jgi:5-methylthioribose kinase
MGIFDKVKKTTIESRRYEEKLYEVALEEVEAGEIRKGLYSKALAKADGDKEKADGIYLKLRVQSITDDIESDQIDRRENERAYKALQEFRNAEAIESKPDLKTECRELLGYKGYELHKSTLGEYQVGDKNNPIYSSKDLNDIKRWAIGATNASN